MPAFREHLSLELSGPLPPALWSASTFLLAVSGPLGTSENCTFAHRALFWAITLGAIILLSGIFRAVLHRALGWRHMMRDLPLVAAAVSALLVAPVSAVAQSHVIAKGSALDSPLPETMLFLFMAAMVVGAYSYLSSEQAMGAPRQGGVDLSVPDGSGPRLLHRLDRTVQGEILSITGRDHYVDVLTTKGRASILMRFSDAMAEAAPTDGAQVHRSHWVAWSAVRSVERRGDKVELVLAHGGRVPVSRSYRDLIGQRGLGG